MHRCIMVVPCYNEADRLDVARFAQFAEQHRNIGFVMVNDGSTDDTLAVIQRLERINARAFQVLDMPQNSGKAEAVRRGMLRALDAEADSVGYWDADLATPLEEIPDFVMRMKNEPAVMLIMGSRIRLLGHQIDRHPVRHVLGRVFATAASLVLRLPVYDTQCGAKLFRAGPVTRRLFDQPFRSGWVFDVELLARLARVEASDGFANGERVREHPLRVWRDVTGSKVRPSAFIFSFFQLALIAWTYRAAAVSAMPGLKLQSLPLAKRSAPRAEPTRMPHPATRHRKTA